MKSTVVLGYEVGTGAPVEIPIRHMAIAGQTQEAGKTTTLEALITRSNRRAVTFVTKRGEGSFENARRIAPYFREQTDWQFVASILEASRGEKLRVERAFVIRASKGARTLADVQANVRKALADPKTKGFASDMYLCLDAYLDVVVPQISTVKWAPTLDLQPGVNAVDLGDMPLEMQHLVIRSAITWVLEREKGTVIVVPEAWKFIPQSRGTPVKLAAEAFIRQGAALGNYLWLDSQDLGGIDKAILRSVAVWLLGVQREANEIKRTLENIPAIPSKPKPADIATLGLGEFFACWSDKRVKTYVQPAWMDEQDARARALNETTNGGRRGEHSRRPDDRVPPPPTFTPTRQEEPEMCEKHEQLARDVADLKHHLELSREAADTAVRDARKAEERLAPAENLFRQLAYALVKFLPAGAGGGTAAPVDEDAIVRRVLAQVSAGGSGPISVTPPEALRLQVQKDVAGRIVATVRELPTGSKRILKVLIALDKRVSQREAADRAGLGWGGGVIAAYKALSDGELIDSHQKGGTRSAVRDRIVAQLADLGADGQAVEAVYQTVLHAIATESEVGG